MTDKKAGRGGLGDEDPRRALARMIEDAAPRWGRHEVFADFLELSCLSISNAVDKAQFAAREALYLEIAKKYPREDLERFPRMLGCLTVAMEQCHATGELEEVLGAIYMQLGIGNEGAGQFFTPYQLSQFIARMLVGDGAEARARGFLDVLEPACGAGGMVIATADALRQAGLNHQQAMHATCIDIDARCVHMCYLQLSLLHIPAVVIHGNALSLEVWSRWYTPAHVLGGWRRRIERRHAGEQASGLMAEAASTATADEPSPGAEDHGHAPSPAPPHATAAGRPQDAVAQALRANAQMLLFGD